MLLQNPFRGIQRIGKFSCIEIDICPVLVQTESIPFIHVFVIHRCICFQIFDILPPQAVQPSFRFSLEVRLLLIGIECRIYARRERRRVSRTQGEHVTSRSLVQLLPGRHLQASPYGGELLLRSPQRVHLIQQREQCSLRLQHIPGNTPIILPGHILQKIIERFGLRLSHLERVHNTNGLLDIVPRRIGTLHNGLFQTTIGRGALL